MGEVVHVFCRLAAFRNDFWDTFKAEVCSIWRSKAQMNKQDRCGEQCDQRKAEAGVAWLGKQRREV